MPTTGFKYHVFLSHNGADKPAVEELAVRLRCEEIRPWLDIWNLIPGERWQPAIEKALDECATCAVFIGAKGLGTWQNEEMRAAIERRVGDSQGQFRVIPVLLPGTDRPERGKLPTFLTATTWVEFRRSHDDEEAFRLLVCGIRGEEPGPVPGGAPSKAALPESGHGSAAFEGACPYRGLEVFDVEHAPFFFGREALTEWLIVALRASPSGQENRFLAILGASGSGKSSLARAGLVAALKRGALDGSGAWPIVILKPGRNPMESLAVALAGLSGGASLIKDTRDLLNIKAFGDDQKSLHLFARLALREAPPSRRLVVLVDQSEEVFTLCEDEAARKALFDNLLYAATVPDGQAIVVLTMRADFYGKCGSYPALAAAMSDHQLLVGPMTEDELRRAIERPALLAGGEFEPRLVEMLLHEVAGRPGSLPLLQFTLMELWGRREGRRLTVAAYKAIGELEGAIKNRADNVLGQFDDAQRDLCRRIFLRLTQPGEGIEDTKRRASFGELVPAGADPKAVEAVVRRLADARLITTEGAPKAGGERSVEVAHEALIRGWGRLREWIDADRAGLRIQRQLTEAAREWEANGRESSFLYGGTRLAVAREWAKTHRDELNALEAEFLAASRRKRLKLKLARAASILVLMASAIGGWWWYQSQKKIRLDQLTHAVDRDMEEAKQLDLADRWAEAIKVLEGAQSRLEPSVEHEPLRRRVASALTSYSVKEEERKAQEVDRKVINAIREARLQGATNEKKGDAVFLGIPQGDSTFSSESMEFLRQMQGSVIRSILSNSSAAVSGYQRAFSEYGIDISALPTERAIELIRTKRPEIREALAAALDEWAWLSGNSSLRTIARGADPNPQHNTISDAVADGDVPTLRRLARERDVVHQPVTTLDRLGNALVQAREFGDAITLLREVQRLHPDDFWINHDLAGAYILSDPPQYDEAIPFFTAAVAIHHVSPGANLYLGFALHNKGRIEDAIFYYDKAIGLDPENAAAYSSRGDAWYAKQEFDKAITDYREAVRLVAIRLDLRTNSLIGGKLQWRGAPDQADADAPQPAKLRAADFSGVSLDLPLSSILNSLNRLTRDFFQRGQVKSVSNLVIVTKDVPPGSPPQQAATITPNVDFPAYARAVDEARKANNPKVTAIRVKRPAQAPEFAVDARGFLVVLLRDVDLELPAPDPSSQAGSVIGVPARILRIQIPQLELAYSHQMESPTLGSHRIRAKIEDFAPSITSQVLAINDDESKATPLTRFSGALVISALGARLRSQPIVANLDNVKKTLVGFTINKVLPLDLPGWIRVDLIRGAFTPSAGIQKEDHPPVTEQDKTIQPDPKYSWAYTNRGRAWYDKKEYDKAIADYDKAIALDPKFALAYTNRGRAWYDKKEYDKAIADYDKAIELDPKYSWPYNNRGLIWHAKQEYDKAIADYNEAIRLDPKNALVYANRGLIWYAKQEYDKAIADYNEAIRLDPKNALAYNNRGNAWRDKREYDKAIADYGEAIRLDPTFAWAFNNRGNAWHAKKEYDKAFADYREVIRLDPTFAWASNNRGLAWAVKREYDKAIADYSEAIRLDPKFAWASNNRGLAWAAKREYDKAIADYSEAIRLDPKFAWASNNRGDAWAAKREYDKAIADYGEAIRLDPKYSWPYNNRGLIWYAKQEYDKAIADYNEAIRLDPKNALVYANRGNAWAAKREYDKAIADYNEAIRLDPKNAAVYFSRGIAYVCTSRDGAASDSRTYLSLQGWRDDQSLYAILIGHFGHRQMHRDAEARQILDEAASKGNTSAWPYPVIRYLRREIDEKALLDAAGDNDKMTEARTYLGLDDSLSGHPEEALPHLRWVKEHGNESFIEYGIALAEIDRIEGRKAEVRP